MDDLLTRIMNECPGWGPIYHKAGIMMGLIRDRKIQLSVEIGVYGGRSLFPMALAHKQTGSGKAFGIDPWSRSSALQEGLDAINADVDKHDFESLYKQTRDRIVEYGLQDHCLLIRKESAAALDAIPEGVELLHIDGNHAENAVTNDVKNYLPKVKTGGLIWFDDASWATIVPAIELAKKSCKLFQTVDKDNIVLEKL